MNQLPKFERKEKDTILDRLKEEPHHMMMYWGPRQSGKTTLIKQVLAAYPGESLYINVDEFNEEIEGKQFPQIEKVRPEGRRAAWMLYCWDHMRRRARKSQKTVVFVIDEVQKIDDWSRRVKGMWDRDRMDSNAIHIILLGSSPHLLQKGLSESLHGRYYQIKSYHWCYAEMSQAFGFSLDEFIYYGGYPGAAKLIHKNKEWRQYVRTSIINNNIHGDVLGLLDIEHPKILKKLYEIGSKYSAQIFEFQKISAATQGGRQPLLEEYLDILERVYMLTGLFSWANSMHRRSGSPKFQVLNNALMSCTHGYTLEEAKADQEYWGRLVESAVGAHILNSYDDPSAQLYYWRQNGHEVDFVVERGPKLVAIEVKSGRKVKAHEGMHEFQRRFQPTKTLVVGTGGIPLEEFFSISAEKWCESEKP